MKYKRVVVTGLGAVTPIGLNIEEFWQGLVQGKNGVGKITAFDPTNFPVKLAAEVKGFNAEKYMPLKRVDRNSRTTHLAIAAAKMALESSGLDLARALVAGEFGEAAAERVFTANPGAVVRGKELPAVVQETPSGRRKWWPF